MRRCLPTCTATVFAIGIALAMPTFAATPAPTTHHFSAAIDAGDFSAYLKAVSSDAFEGRKPGTEGARRTVDYLVAQFKRMGLQPGNHGQWFQTVPAVSTTLQHPEQLRLDVTENGRTLPLAYGSDMVAVTLQAKPKVTLKRSDIVFVGYGIDAPEYQWNDYAGIDVKGKTVIVLVNDPGYATQDPKLFRGRTMTYYGRWTYKYEQAAREGAAACFIVHATGPAGYPWSVVHNSWSGPQLSLPAGEHAAPRLPVAGWLSGDAARHLFAASGLDFDTLEAAAARRGFKPVPLKAQASITLDSTIRHTHSRNVLALLKGSEHPDQAVIYSAHWDHFGRDPKLKGDQIYNGAIDNGTGVAALLEIAEAFAHQQPRPKRSLLFAAVTMEESGLLGSQYYVEHPVFPLNRTVADINMDALDIIGPTKNMIVVGYGQSQLEDRLKGVLAKQGRTLSPEPTPENGFYFRSDHFSFAKAGVPAMDTLTGDDLVDGGTRKGRALLADYTAHRYHTPQDNYDPHWDFRGVIRDIQALHDVGQQLADGSDWPQWNAGSEFRARRQAMMQANDPH
ncbi:M28 family metallopeptidase [Rhodanobacter sp. 115]|uniref:M28 family metallopeptidase n=2 Tax=Rhodanobacter sp. FW021-MT20 TaxID=1162282 RepID=UPI0034E4A4BD